MAELKLGPLVEDKPVKTTVELPASLNRDLVAYADALAIEPLLLGRFIQLFLVLQDMIKQSR